MDVDEKLNFDFENAFNTEEYLYFYKDILSDERLKKEIDFLIKYTELERPLAILDLACGHGRHANALAQMEHHVTGIDSSQGFLKIAQDEALKLGAKVKYIHQDMRNISFNNVFDRIFVMFNAIGYFDDDQNETVFRNIFNALKPNGIFCFDSHNRDTFMTYYLPFTVVEREGNFMVDQHTFDSLSGRCVTKRTVMYKQATKSYQYSVRFYNPTEIMKLFKKIGFSNTSFYEDWSGSPLGQKSKRMIVIAQK